jgi:hypothetical protein
MVYTIKTSKEDKEKAIKAELVYQAKDILSDLAQYYKSGDKFDYEGVLDTYHCFAAKNIQQWDNLTWAIESAEYDLEHTDYNMDMEAGNPCAAYEAAYEKLTDLQDEAEEWANTFEHMFEDFFNKLYDLLYGEEA